MSIVIVGAGLAGGTAATELREQGYQGPVVLVGSEEHPPYERPPLSKGYLLGNDPIDDAFVHPRDWYAEHDVDLRTGVEATALDTDAHVVTTTGGDLTYERLLLATGAEPRRLALADEGSVDELFESVMTRHYDPCYARSTRRNFGPENGAASVDLASLSPEGLTEAIERLIASESW